MKYQPNNDWTQILRITSLSLISRPHLPTETTQKGGKNNS